MDTNAIFWCLHGGLFAGQLLLAWYVFDDLKYLHDKLRVHLQMMKEGFEFRSKQHTELLDLITSLSAKLDSSASGGDGAK